MASFSTLKQTDNMEASTSTNAMELKPSTTIGTTQIKPGHIKAEQTNVNGSKDLIYAYGDQDNEDYGMYDDFDGSIDIPWDETFDESAFDDRAFDDGASDSSSDDEDMEYYAPGNDPLAVPDFSKHYDCIDNIKENLATYETMAAEMGIEYTMAAAVLEQDEVDIPERPNRFAYYYDDDDDDETEYDDDDSIPMLVAKNLKYWEGMLDHALEIGRWGRAIGVID